MLHLRDVVLLGTPGSSHISPWTAPCCTQSRFSRLQAEHFGRVLSHLTLRERQVEHAFDRGLIAFLLICCKSHRKKKARPSHQIGKYARPRRPKTCRFAHTGELLLGVKVWCFGGKHTQRQIGSRKPTARDVVGEHSKLVTEQTKADFGCSTFYSASTAFSVEFAQEVKAEVGFSPCHIGVFGQIGVLEISLSSLSAKGFSQMAGQWSPLSSANTCSFWKIMLAVIGISNTTSS